MTRPVVQLPFNSFNSANHDAFSRSISFNSELQCYATLPIFLVKTTHISLKVDSLTSSLLVVLVYLIANPRRPSETVPMASWP